MALWLLDFVDWRFERFVTPWVLRITWLLFLVQSVLWLLYLLLGGFGGTVGALLPDRPAYNSSDDLPWRTRRAGSDTEFTPRRSISAGLANAIARVIAVIWTAVVMLWVRVVLELWMVLFTGTRVVTEIRDLLKNRGPPTEF